MNQHDHITLSVLLLREGDGWVVQCLEYDIAAQGTSVREAQEAFESVFEAQIALDAASGRPPLDGIKRAPDWYWERFREAAQLRDALSLRAPRNAPPAYLIHARAEARVA